MKQRLSIVSLAVVLLFSACVKDGDFSELNHPLRLQGSFDPTYGFPVAWADADLGTLMGFVPAGAKFVILADPYSGLLTMEKDSVLHKSFVFDGSQGVKKGTRTKDGKEVVFRRTINHGNKIGLEDLKKHDMVIKRLDLILTAYVKAEISGSTRELLESDAEVFFDIIDMTIDFEDGTTYTTQLDWGQRVNAQQMVEGTTILLAEYDASPWVNREAKRVHFNTAVNVAATGTNFSPTYLKDSLNVDSLIVDCHALVDFPAILYVGNLNEVDTLEADMSALDSIMQDPEIDAEGFSLSLNEDSVNYLYIQADNGIPANLTIQLRGLDSNYADVTGLLLPDQQFLYPAPVTVVPDSLSTGLYEGYMADGRTPCELRVEVTTTMLRQLAKSKYLELSLHVTSPTELDPVGEEAKPFVIIRDVDRLKLKISLKVSTHIGLNIPIDQPLEK